MISLQFHFCLIYYVPSLQRSPRFASVMAKMPESHDSRFLDHFNASSVSTSSAHWCRMGGVGLVWCWDGMNPSALTHNVTTECERASTECMHFFPLPLGGALSMHTFTAGKVKHVLCCVCVSICSISICLYRCIYLCTSCFTIFLFFSKPLFTFLEANLLSGSMLFNLNFSFGLVHF